MSKKKADALFKGRTIVDTLVEFRDVSESTVVIKGNHCHIEWDERKGHVLVGLRLDNGANLMFGAFSPFDEETRKTLGIKEDQLPRIRYEEDS